MRVLVIEDERTFAESLKRSLESAGCAVDVLEDGNDALTRLSLYRDAYDVTVLDLTLPGLSGENVCREARAQGVTMPILVLSGHTETGRKIDLLHLGADDYMVKPFAFDELYARLQALLRRPRESLPSTLTVLDITLDPIEHTASRAGNPLDLTRKEFALLEFFMRHPNQVFNREQMLDRMWDFDFSSLSNVVDVHINNLRKKLGPDGDEIIETVRGIGYRMRA